MAEGAIGRGEVDCRAIVFATVLIVVVVLGFAFYYYATALRQQDYVLTQGIPSRFEELRLLPAVLYQKPLSAFTVYNASGGFNVTTGELERGIAALFPSLEASNNTEMGYVVSNITLQYSSLDVAVVRPPPSGLQDALAEANQSLFGSICEYVVANPQGVFCGHLGDTPYMVYYQVVSFQGSNYYSYTVLAWSSSEIALIHYQSTIDVSVLQLEKMANMLLQQQI